MKRSQFLGMTAAMLFGVGGAAFAAIEKIAPDPKGVRLCTEFLAALSRADEKVRLAAVLPLLHKSMLTADGKDLDPQVKQFSYQKAVKGAQFYAQPAEIFEVHKGVESTVGFQQTAETGRTDKYFVKKKPDQPGRPAPLHVFWPKGGGEPRLINIGSL